MTTENRCGTARSAIFGARRERVCGVLADSRIDGAHETRGLGGDRRQILLRFERLLPLLRARDDMLKVAGMWVSPVEVENALLGHPTSRKPPWLGQRCAGPDAFGGACGAAGEVRGSEQLAVEICEHVKARLVSYKVPREVRFCSELPKTVTGKIQRFKLRGA